MQLTVADPGERARKPVWIGKGVGGHTTTIPPGSIMIRSQFLFKIFQIGLQVPVGLWPTLL